MINPRRYGSAPFNIAVIHGGPGASGEMAVVAMEISSVRGVLEPLQTATSVEGQIQELKSILEENGEAPVTLIGFSWGAWLSFILAASYPDLVNKLVLIGCGPFEERYASSILESRLKRLSIEERTEIISIFEVLDDPGSNCLGKDLEDSDKALARMGALFSRADAYCPINYQSEMSQSDAVECDAKIYQGVWKEAAELRRSGKLLEMGDHIRCPVVAIHGDYDPHPSEGVQAPLSAVLNDFSFILLKNCGHKPWIEREIRDEFFRILKEELSLSHGTNPHQ